MKLFLCSLTFLVALTGNMFALDPIEIETSTPGRGWDSVSLRLSYYENDDDAESGNPFLDETLQVVEPVIVFNYNVNYDESAWGKISYDWVSSASIDRLSRFPAQSGATGDYYIGLEGGYNWSADKSNQWSVNAHASTEYDYLSLGLAGGWAREFEETGDKLDLGLNLFVDTIDIIRFNGAQNEGTEQRLSLTASTGYYQTYSERLHGEFGGFVTLQDGFLETAYNAVVIEDGVASTSFIGSDLPGREVTEELPDTRLRGAVYGRWRYSINQRTAAELGGRLYADDWGIVGLTVEPRLYYELIPDVLTLRARYRYYTQSEADDFSGQFLSETEFRTQDADLSDFDASTLGLKFIYNHGSSVTYDMGGDFTTRSDGLDYYMLSVGVKYRF